jgi:hypothetical protein
VVLGHVVAVQAAAVVGLDQRQPIGVLRAEIVLRSVHVVEDAELHATRWYAIECGDAVL